MLHILHMLKCNQSIASRFPKKILPTYFGSCTHITHSHQQFFLDFLQAVRQKIKHFKLFPDQRTNLSSLDGCWLVVPPTALHLAPTGGSGQCRLTRTSQNRADKSPLKLMKFCPRGTENTLSKAGRILQDLLHGQFPPNMLTRYE